MTTPAAAIESRYAWFRLAATVALGTIGGVGMWSIVVSLPAVQAEFGTARAGASMPYTLAMIGFMFGGVFLGRLADRFGAIAPALIGTLSLCAGYIATAFAPTMTIFAILYGVLVGMFGSAAVFGPLIADTSHWFDRNRGFAMALCAAGNYFAGTLWPPALQHFIAEYGWRNTHIGIGLFCLVTMLPLAFALRRPSPVQHANAAGGAQHQDTRQVLGLAPNTVQALLLFAGVCCCVAMSMPQVHIVAYCVDLGYGAARGAEMLSLMLGFGIVSRLASGWILDRIGGLATLLLGSALQAMALALYLPFDGLTSLYIISAVFGLVQGGIVPSYAFIVREVFPPGQAGLRVSLSLAATLAGMALGGWLSGAIFDLTGSYRAAVVNGLIWNLANVAVVGWLLLRRHERALPASA